MLRISQCLCFLAVILLASCKGDEKVSEVETRKQISEQLEKSGLQKESHHSDEVIAAMNVIYKSSYESLGADNQGLLKSWSNALNADGPKKLYDELFASFNLTEQTASLIKEYSEKEFTSYHDRDVYNQTVSLLFLKENEPEAYKKNLALFTGIANATAENLNASNTQIDVKSWNKGMNKNFAEYWYVHASRIMEAANTAQTSTLDDFLKREAS